MLVTSKVEGYEENSIFLPAAGYMLSSRISDGSKGCYWSSSLGTANRHAFGISFDSGFKSLMQDSRFYGMPVRPVSID